MKNTKLLFRVISIVFKRCTIEGRMTGWRTNRLIWSSVKSFNGTTSILDKCGDTLQGGGGQQIHVLKLCTTLIIPVYSSIVTDQAGKYWPTRKYHMYIRTYDITVTASLFYVLCDFIERRHTENIIGCHFFSQFQTKCVCCLFFSQFQTKCVCCLFFTIPNQVCFLFLFSSFIPDPVCITNPFIFIIPSTTNSAWKTPNSYSE